ncbi:hypothetical protein WJX84_010062 [Apatococcus fuscideae]|uniref:Uncharacterized protein n=1 Tax=Apatococcus fuscideae TaxID=2026836 RepID=A0AAW1SSI3_9CHLO
MTRRQRHPVLPSGIHAPEPRPRQLNRDGCRILQCGRKLAGLSISLDLRSRGKPGIGEESGIGADTVWSLPDNAGSLYMAMRLGKRGPHTVMRRGNPYIRYRLINRLASQSASISPERASSAAWLRTGPSPRLARLLVFSQPAWTVTISGGAGRALCLYKWQQPEYRPQLIWTSVDGWIDPDVTDIFFVVCLSPKRDSVLLLVEEVFGPRWLLKGLIKPHIGSTLGAMPFLYFDTFGYSAVQVSSSCLSSPDAKLVGWAGDSSMCACIVPGPGEPPNAPKRPADGPACSTLHLMGQSGDPLLTLPLEGSLLGLPCGSGHMPEFESLRLAWCPASARPAQFAITYSDLRQASPAVAYGCILKFEPTMDLGSDPSPPQGTKDHADDQAHDLGQRVSGRYWEAHVAAHAAQLALGADIRSSIVLPRLWPGS